MNYRKMQAAIVFALLSTGLLFQNFRSLITQPTLSEPNIGRRGTLKQNVSGPRKYLAAMATTPDGRLLVDRLSGFGVSFQTLKQFNPGEQWNNSQSANSLLAQHSPSAAVGTRTTFDLPYPAPSQFPAITYNPADEDLSLYGLNLNALPEGHRLDVDLQSDRQGTVFFDTSFGETAFSVETPETCLRSERVIRNLKPGNFLCYKLIVLMPVRIATFNGTQQVKLEPLDFSFRRAYQAPVTVVVKHKENGTLLRDPQIVTAVFTAKAEMAIADGINPSTGHRVRTGVSALEVTSTSDGRLLMWNESEADKFSARPHNYFIPTSQSGAKTAIAVFALNETPSNPRSWQVPVYLFDLAPIYGNQEICPTTLPCTNKVKLRELFRLAEEVPIAGDGTDKPLHKNYRCAYGWLTVDGSHALCGVEGPVSAIIGPGTGFRIKAIDAPINSFTPLALQVAKMNSVFGQTVCQDADDTNCFRPIHLSSWGTSEKITERPQMPVGLGTSFGFWKSMPQSRPGNFLLSKRQPSFQVFLRNDLLTLFRPPTVLSDGTMDNQLRLVTQDSDFSRFEYAEITTQYADDKNFVFFYEMDPAINQIGNPASSVENGIREMNLLADATGRSVIGKLLAGARFEPDYYGSSATNPESLSIDSQNYRQLFSAEGFQGRGIVMTNVTGQSQIVVDHERMRSPFTQMTFEAALRPLYEDIQLMGVTVANFPNAFSLRLEKSRVVLRVQNNLGQTHSIFAHTGRTPSGDLRLSMNRYIHLGFTFKGSTPSAAGELAIYADGDLLARSTLPASFTTLSSQSVLQIGPGSCVVDGCPSSSGGLMILDNVGLSNVSRPDKYFRIAAYKKDTEVNADPSLYRHSLPPGFQPSDLAIPKPLAGIMTSTERYSASVNLGKRLFGDTVLSTHAGGNNNISCQTCHQPERYFTDGRRTSVGVLPLSINSPTIVNRIFSKEQFFDQRSGDLFDQVIHPVTDPKEMGGNWVSILGRLRNDSSYVQQFVAAFGNSGTSPTQDHVRMALASYLGTIRSGVNNMDKKLKNDTKFAFGFQVFNNRGRCVACHSGSNFSDELRHITEKDKASIKTPSLINIALTSPYMMDGSKPTLREVINSYNRPVMGSDVDREIRPLGLTESEIDALEYFLTNLNGTVQEGIN